MEIGSCFTLFETELKHLVKEITLSIIQYFVKKILHRFLSSLSWNNFSNQWVHLEDGIDNRPLQTNENNDTLDDEQL